MKTPSMKNKKAGFTLIELIVVIAIIGLLSSVVMSSIVKSRARAEVTKVLTEYKSVSSALELYRQSSGDYPGRDIEGQAMSISNLMPYLSAYLQQTPGVSPTVVANGSIYYYLNPKDGSNRYLCGPNASQNQDYVLYFAPTGEATDSGLFKQLYDSEGAAMSGEVCIAVNQN